MGKYRKRAGLLVLTGDDPDRWVFFLPVLLKRKRDQRRERLLRKWGKTYYFKQLSISEKFECEFLSLTPNDGKWHHMSMSLLVWVKKEKPKKSQKADTKMANVQVYSDDMMVGERIARLSDEQLTEAFNKAHTGTGESNE